MGITVVLGITVMLGITVTFTVSTVELGITVAFAVSTVVLGVTVTFTVSTVVLGITVVLDISVGSSVMFAVSAVAFTVSGMDWTDVIVDNGVVEMGDEVDGLVVSGSPLISTVASEVRDGGVVTVVLASETVMLASEGSAGVVTLTAGVPGVTVLDTSAVVLFVSISAVGLSSVVVCKSGVKVCNPSLVTPVPVALGVPVFTTLCVVALEPDGVVITDEVVGSVEMTVVLEDTTLKPDVSVVSVVVGPTLVISKGPAEVGFSSEGRVVIG